MCASFDTEDITEYSNENPNKQGEGTSVNKIYNPK